MLPQQPIRLIPALIAAAAALLIASAAWCDTPADGTPVGQISIEIIDGGEDPAYWESMARALIRIRPGAPFSLDALTRAIRRLKQSGMFGAIDVPDPAITAGDAHLRFRLTPFPRIKEIRISGAFPVFEKEILSALSVYTGDAFVPSRVETDTEAVRQLFIQQGYIRPQVEIRPEQDPQDRNYRLFITIDKGPFWQIQEVSTTGNRTFSATRLLLRTATWKASLFPGGISRFVQKDLDADEKNLTRFYWAKGYPDAAVTAEVERDTETRQVVIRFRIDEGPRYAIAFEGNDAYWTWRLKRDLALADRGNKDDRGIRKSERNLRERYESDGFLDAQIDVESTETADQERPVKTVRFDITEKRQSIVKSVTIAGNHHLSTDEIRDELLTRPPGFLHDGAFVPDVLKEDLKSIKSLYLQHGYLSAAAEEQVTWEEPAADADPNERFARVAFQIDEGPQTIVKEIALEGVTLLDREAALSVLSTKTDAPFRPYLIKNDENLLAETIAEMGYPYVKVTGGWQVSEDGRRAAVRFTVSEGAMVTMGEIFFEGNFRTAEDILRAELALEPDAPFSAKKLLESQRNITSMNALDAAYFKPIGLAERTERVDLIIEVAEKKPYVFQIGGGYDTGKGFFFNLLAADRNLFGRNKELSASAEISEIGYRVDLSLTEPRFLGYRISSTTTLFGERLEEFNKDFGTDTFGATQTFGRRFLSDRLSLNLAFLLEYRDQYKIDDTPIAPEEASQYEERVVLVTTPSVLYNSVDNYARPRSGLYTAFYLDISTGLLNSLDNFLKYRFETKYYWTPAAPLTFALRGRYRFIDPFNSDSTVPDDQLFYLGGTADIRGFDENRLRSAEDGSAAGGRESFLGSVEARIDIGFNFEAAAFLDVGSLRQSDAATGSDDFRSSAGLGLRYITPVGPIGVLYGWKLDPKEGESAGRWHFSIGYTF